MSKKKTSNLGDKKAAPFKQGGGRDTSHKNTYKGTPRKSPSKKKS